MSYFRLTLRQLRSRPWPMALLAFAVAMLTLLCTAVPSLATELGDRQLRQRLASLSAIQGDVTADWTTYVGGNQDPWPSFIAAAEEIRTAQPDPLRALLSPAGFVAEYPTSERYTPPLDSGYFRVTLTGLVDPDLSAHAKLTEGAWPQLRQNTGPLEVAVVKAVADRMKWRVGDTIGSRSILVGIFNPNDPNDPRWEHLEFGRRYLEKNDPNAGLELVLGVFFNREFVRLDTLGSGQGFKYKLWWRLGADQVSDGVDVTQLSAQVTGMTARRYSLLPDRPADPVTISPQSEISRALDSVATEQATGLTLTAISAAGPIGVGLALVALAATLVVHRRRKDHALLLARGLSVGQLRRVTALEGAVVCLPAAAAGMLAGASLTTGAVDWTAWAAVMLINLVAAAALALAVRKEITGARHDLSARGGRWRVVAEVLAGLFSAAACWRLLHGGAGSPGPDLLATATPLLVAMAACLVALRCYPLPLGLLHRAFARGRGLAGFLGTARGLRSPAGGIVPIATIVLGSTMAVTCAALLSTMSEGTSTATWDRIGSSISISGPSFDDDLVAQLSAIEGVSSVARIFDAGIQRARWGDAERPLRLWVADPSLGQAYAVWGGESVVADLGDGTGVPQLLVGGSVPDLPVGATQLADLGPVQAIGRAEVLPGVVSVEAWGLLSSADATAAGLPLPRPTLALIAVDSDADPVAVAAQLSLLIRAGKVSVASDELRELQESPTITGLAQIFTVLTAATSLLLVMSVFTAQTLSSDERRPLLAVLRALGVRASQLRRLTGWELGPIIAFGLLVGTGLGIALAWLLLHTVDFRPVTGGSLAPALFLDPATMWSVLGGLVLAALAAVVISAWQSGRAALAQELRIGEER